MYFVLAFAYKWYLEYSKTSAYQPDYITYHVANQSQILLNAMGFESDIALHQGEPWVRLLLNGTYIVRIIEGCNAVSVIILFIAFIVAFASGLKKTILYIIAGSVLIYVANVLRIAILTIGLYKYPQFEHILHGVVFPLLIYGMVFLLWVVWVNYFVKQKKKHEKPATL